MLYSSCKNKWIYACNKYILHITKSYRLICKICIGQPSWLCIDMARYGYFLIFVSYFFGLHYRQQSLYFFLSLTAPNMFAAVKPTHKE